MNLESIQIHLSSKYATNYNNGLTSDCDFFLPTIEIPSQHTFYVSVVHAVIPYSFYSINNSNNTIFYQQFITDAIVTSQIVITPGNYNAYQLAIFLSAQLPNTTVAYNINTNKFTFTNALYDFCFLSTTTATELLGLPMNTCFSLLKTYTSVNPINVNSKTCLCIASNLTTGNLNNSNKNDIKILCSIPITCQPFGLITYVNSSKFRSNIYNNSLSMINIKLVDQLGNSIDLNNMHFSLTLQLDVIDFVN